MSETSAGVVLRPIGLAQPMGYCGLATASVLLAGQHLGWFASTEAHAVGLLVLVSVVPLQALAAIFSILTRDTVTATSSALLASTWAAEAAVALGSPPGSTSDPLGVFLLAAGLGLTVPVAAGLSTRVLPSAVPGLAAVSFILAGLYQLTTGSLPRHLGGIVELSVAALALYVAFGLTLEESLGRPALPLGRRGPARQALEGDLAAQLDSIAHTPGVRRPA